MSSRQATKPVTNKYIQIEKTEILNDNTIVFKISCSKQIRDCLFSDTIYVQYDKPISSLDTSILNVPAVSGLITIAWAYGADFYVEELDETYLESLRKIQPKMIKMYPDFQGSRINVQKVVPHKFCNNKYGLLYSGGIDCITSYIKYLNEKPELIHVWGIDVHSDDNESWSLRERMLNEFSAKTGAHMNVIRTNIREIIDKDFLHRKFGLDWWPNVSFDIVLSGLTAPLTCIADINRLLVASGETDEYKYPSGECPPIVNSISWGDIQVLLDNRELSRQLKIRYFLKDFTTNYFYPFLKVCNKDNEPASNCGVCEKCQRSIVGLVTEGIDPVKCGLNGVDGKTFEKIKGRFCSSSLLSKKFFLESRGEFYERMSTVSLWDDIHQHIPEKIEQDIRGSKEFLEWFRNFNLPKYLEQKKNSVVISPSKIAYNCLLYLTNFMPKNCRVITNQLIKSLAHDYEKFRW